MFEKYNPLIAGCIQGNREILSRDILAVILGLINKKIIKLEFLTNSTQTKDAYKYYIEKNPEKENEMDEIGIESMTGEEGNPFSDSDLPVKIDDENEK